MLFNSFSDIGVSPFLFIVCILKQKVIKSNTKNKKI
nr:MAG TPA: hypothetical protein [Bacteriophage sp.]